MKKINVLEGMVSFGFGVFFVLRYAGVALIAEALMLLLVTLKWLLEAIFSHYFSMWYKYIK